jgi:anti-anti-sigma regulatory factor
MRTKIRSVAVRKLPEQITGAQRQHVYKDLEACINVDKPAVVLDCSTLHHVDRSAIHLLLCCLEEAMKRNGDVRLAAATPELKAAVRTAEVESLFLSFDTIGEAIESFRRPQIDFIQLQNPVQDAQNPQMNAA